MPMTNAPLPTRFFSVAAGTPIIFLCACKRVSTCACVLILYICEHVRCTSVIVSVLIRNFPRKSRHPNVHRRYNMRECLCACVRARQSSWARPQNDTTMKTRTGQSRSPSSSTLPPPARFAWKSWTGPENCRQTPI